MAGESGGIMTTKEDHRANLTSIDALARDDRDAALAALRGYAGLLFAELESERTDRAWQVRDLETMIQNEHKLYADAMEKRR